MNKFFPTTGIFNITPIVYIWGFPLDFTLSPFFQEHASFFNQKRIIYKPFRKEADEFKEMLSGDSCAGANITIPYKIQVLNICDELTKLAQDSGSVNTIYKIGRKIIGDNTDGDGFVKWFEMKNTFSKSFQILGNGGTSRAIAASVSKRGVEIIIFGRKEKGWEKKWGEFRNLEKWKDEQISVNTLPFEIIGRKVINISYKFGKISPEAAQMLAFQGFLSMKKWFPDSTIEIEKFLEIVKIHSNAQSNTKLILKISGML